MCFSAPASFIAAGITGAVGIACLRRTAGARELPLAAMPVLFAVQQGVEGALWLALPADPGGAEVAWLSSVFLLFALVIWPVYSPLAALLIETDERRALLMRIVLAIGVGVGAYFARVIVFEPHTTTVEGGHLAYFARRDLPFTMGVMYLIATCAGPLLSSHGVVRLIGLIVVTASMITWANYWQAFTSVWCFFAAAASAVTWLHFERAARQRTAAPAA